MVENEYSDRIKDFIILWGKKYSNKLRITKIYSKNKALFQVGLPAKKKIDYKPDGAYTLNRKDTVIFEVLDTQVKSKTIADVIRCIFNQTITDLIIITKTKKSFKTSLDTSDVLLELFDDFLTPVGNSEGKKQTPLNIHFIKITETESKNKKTMEKRFNAKLPKSFSN